MAKFKLHFGMRLEGGAEIVPHSQMWIELHDSIDLEKIKQMPIPMLKAEIEEKYKTEEELNAYLEGLDDRSNAERAVREQLQAAASMIVMVGMEALCRPPKQKREEENEGTAP